MKELSLFTGMGGGIYGSLILGWETIGYVEKEEYCQQVIKQRQEDGWFDTAPIYGDIHEFNKGDAHRYTGRVDVLTGGFPCQPFSMAGKREGQSDERYLMREIIKTIKIVQPRRLFFENVQGILTSDAIIDIYKSLDRIGYRLKPPLQLGSSDCGNIHQRQRIWMLADSEEFRSGGRESEEYRDERIECESSEQERSAVRGETERCAIQDTNDSVIGASRSGSSKVQGERGVPRCESIRRIEDIYDRPDIPEPLLRGVDDELPDWRKQLKAIGNGQDPIVMATAYNLLTQ